MPPLSGDYSCDESSVRRNRPRKRLRKDDALIEGDINSLNDSESSSSSCSSSSEEIDSDLDRGGDSGGGGAGTLGKGGARDFYASRFGLSPPTARGEDSAGHPTNPLLSSHFRRPLALWKLYRTQKLSYVSLRRRPAIRPIWLYARCMLWRPVLPRSKCHKRLIHGEGSALPDMDPSIRQILPPQDQIPRAKGETRDESALKEISPVVHEHIEPRSDQAPRTPGSAAGVGCEETLPALSNVAHLPEGTQGRLSAEGSPLLIVDAKHHTDPFKEAESPSLKRAVAGSLEFPRCPSLVVPGYLGNFHAKCWGASKTSSSDPRRLPLTKAALEEHKQTLRSDPPQAGDTVSTSSTPPNTLSFLVFESSGDMETYLQAWDEVWDHVK